MTSSYISSGTFHPISDYQLQRLDSQRWIGEIFTSYSQATNKISIQFISGFSSLAGLLGKKKWSTFDIVNSKALYITLSFHCLLIWWAVIFMYFFYFMTIDFNSFYTEKHIMLNVLWNPTLLIIHCIKNLNFVKMAKTLMLNLENSSSNRTTPTPFLE